MYKFLFNVCDQRMGVLRQVSERAELSVAELLRRMVDHCCQERVLNELVPSMSGSLTVRG